MRRTTPLVSGSEHPHNPPNITLGTSEYGVVRCGICDELVDVAWVEDGQDVPNWVLGFSIAMCGIILLLVVSLIALEGHGTNQEPPGGIPGGSVATPSPYGPPDAQRGGPVQHNKMEER